MTGPILPITVLDVSSPRMTALKQDHAEDEIPERERFHQFPDASLL